MKDKIVNNFNLNINVVGLGFVGLVTATVLAKKGFFINGVEKNQKKLENIKKGFIEFYEPNLIQNIKTNKKKLNFCSNVVIKKNSMNVVFLCVGTPSKKNGNIDLKYINKFCQNLKKIENEKILLIIKSTVLPGTLNRLILKYFNKNKNIMFCSNPEFLQEGTAFNDFLNSEKILIGVDNKTVKKILYQIYKKFKSKFICTNFVTAEFTKYLSNNLFASLISFSNFMKILSYKINNVELKKSFQAVKIDRRWYGNPSKISNYFHPGIGFGGSCLPKDLRALKYLTSKSLYNNNLLEHFIKINSQITNEVIKKSEKKFITSKKKTIVFLGASFKPGSDDIRESKSILFIEKFMKKKNNKFLIYDEKVKKIKLNGSIKFVINKKPQFKKDNFYILLTEWKSFIKFLKKIPEDNYFDTREIL